MSDGNSKSLGCLFCKTGKEQAIVRQFEESFPSGRAIAPTKSRYRRAKGVVTEEREILLPGYVFFEVDECSEERKLLRASISAKQENDLLSELQFFSRKEDVLKLLRYSDGDWQLHGSDSLFAEMLFRTDGNIDVSQAYFDEGDRIRILSGFLKDYEGCITRVNRKTRTAEIHVDFHEKNVTMWLGYELLGAVK